MKNELKCKEETSIYKYKTSMTRLMLKAKISKQHSPYKVKKQRR
jgi:hypothetical protein